MSQIVKLTVTNKPPIPDVKGKREGNFSHRQLDLLQEIERLKTELQSIAPLLDDEPERTQIKYFSTQSKEIAKLLCQDPLEEELNERLQTLLDSSRKENQKIIFSDKNNQLWEIAMVRFKYLFIAIFYFCSALKSFCID